MQTENSGAGTIFPYGFIRSSLLLHFSDSQGSFRPGAQTCAPAIFTRNDFIELLRLASSIGGAWRECPECPLGQQGGEHRGESRRILELWYQACLRDVLGLAGGYSSGSVSSRRRCNLEDARIQSGRCPEQCGQYLGWLLQQQKMST